MEMADIETGLQEAVQITAQMMAAAAVTAPKTKGENYVAVEVVTGERLQALGESMLAYAEKTGDKGYTRDGTNTVHSDAVVLIGLKGPRTAGLDCGACGYENCAALLAAPQVEGVFRGPTCAFRLLDMGIALGSAAKTASLFNVDSRIMNRVGAAARRMGMVDWEYVMGIPLSVRGKSIYFDR